MKEPRIAPVNHEAIANLYKKCPLQQHEMRILVLHPAHDHIGPIECDFATIDLNGASLDYEAVSYCWGPPVEGWQLYDESLRLRGVEMTIKGNLADALRRFRYQDRERRLWVDALCINQEDHAERADQVAMMAQIYAKAARTLVWLGEDSDEFDGAIIISACKAIDVNGSSFAAMSTEREKWTKQQHQALDAILEVSSAWEAGDPLITKRFNELEYLIATAAEAFIHRRYFTRRWILQELFTSKSAVVHCGSHSIEWAVLTKGCKRLPIQTQRPAPVDPGTDLLQVGVYLEALDTYSSPTQDLMWCLRYFGQSQCSDPRDRIYALLGFSSGADIVSADYTIPPEQVWMRVGLALLEDGVSGLLVTTAAEQLYQGYERTAMIPSWLPDFSAPTDLLPRDFPAGPKPEIDAHGNLIISLLCFGEVKYHNGWPVCSGMPERMLNTVSSLPPGGWSKNGFGYWDSYYFGVPLLKSNANEMRAGDLVCEVPNRKLRSYLLHVRPSQRMIKGSQVMGQIVGIAPVESNGECLEGDMVQFCLR